MPHATGIFLKGVVEYPVEAIFDAPMATHSCAKGSRLPRQAREVIAKFCRHLLAHCAGRFNHANAAQPRPDLPGIEIGNASGIGDRPILASFEASMSFLYPLVGVMLQVSKPGCQGIVKQFHHISKKSCRKS